MKGYLKYVRAWWHVHLALAIGLGVLIAFLVGAFSASGIVTFKVGGHHNEPVKTITVPAAVVQAAAGDFTHSGSRNQAPKGLPKAAVTADQKQIAKFAASDKLPLVFPDAAPSQRGCTTSLVQDFSSRNGVAPRLFVLHYTVSKNIPGWNDVNAIVSIFNNWSYQASSNYVLDGEGNCSYIVRETDKAWTQAAANPYSISVEVIDTGQEAVYLPKPGLDKLALVISDALSRWKIPVQLGAVNSSGLLVKAGIVDHRMLGVAGGGHFDIDQIINGRFDDNSGLARVNQVIAAVKAYRAAHPAHPKKPKPTKAQLKAALRIKVFALRKEGKTWPQVKSTPVWKSYVAVGGK